jgi:phosphatidylglycerophosphatase A
VIAPGLRGLVATGLGVGRLPLAPGTAGSLVGLALAWALHRAGGHAAVAAGTAAVIAAGFWAAGDAERRFGSADPPSVVIDEVAGQMVGVLLLAPAAPALVAGFVLFRLLDVTKPFPIRRLEALPGGSGIMADDLAAGLCANLAQRGLDWAFPGWWGAA